LLENIESNIPTLKASHGLEVREAVLEKGLIEHTTRAVQNLCTDTEILEEETK
jgi:hypothetical protein